MQTRKITKMHWCKRHAAWFETCGGPYRRVECMVEGGPGGMTPGCAGGQCRIWPGTDYFEPSVCTSELDLDWTTDLIEEARQDERAYRDEARVTGDWAPYYAARDRLNQLREKYEDS